jgi:hypothetical protein
METTLLENLETFRNWDYDEEWEIFLSWMDEDADSWGDYDMMGCSPTTTLGTSLHLPTLCP